MAQKALFTIVILLFSLSQSEAQVRKALNTFLGTEFFDEFTTARDRAEDAVLQFQTIQHRYSDQEVQIIIDSYNSSAEYFNRTLYNIKDDLLDKNKRKYIIAYPDSYSKQVETDLRRAQEYYQNTFQKEIVQLTAGEITGFAFIAMIPELIKYIKLGIQAIQKIKNEFNKMNEAILDKYLIEEYRFHTWDEITAGR